MNRKELFVFKDVESAAAKQQQLSLLVREESPHGFRPRLLCGLDAAYKEDWGVGVAAVWDLQESSLVEVGHAMKLVSVDYMPGLLAFREGPLVVAAVEKLRSSPDMFLVDGHGRAHPRRFGLACHVGLALNKPTVGVAKSNLYGGVRKGEVVDSDGITLGRVLESGRNRPLFVSVGHKVSLADAFDAVRSSLVERYPAPLRTAHQEALRLRRNLQS
ncbi:MAG TPA: endonuclease V [Candidatus Bathyarchaeia archaeon]